MLTWPAAALMGLARILIAVYVLAAAGIYFFQESLLFHAEKLPESYSFSRFHRCAERWLAFRGTRISSLLCRAGAPKGTILYFHGNAGNLAGWGEVIEELAERSGWNVWALDYPGYGKSGGKVESEEQLHELAEAFWRLARKELPESKLVVYGRSIGTGLAVKLASVHPPAGLVLESPYLSMSSLAKLKFPVFPGFLLRYPFPSDEWLPSVNGPVLVLHGTQDGLIPFAQGAALSKLAKHATFAPIPDGEHNDLSMHDTYWKELLAWLASGNG